MFRIFPEPERGTSLIELMIASSLMAFIAVGASVVFTRMNEWEAESQVKVKAEDHNRLWVKALQRDFQRRIFPPSGATSLCANGAIQCNSLSYDTTLEHSGIYYRESMTVGTYCLSAPANVRSRYFGSGKQYDFTNVGIANRQGSSDKSQVSKCLHRTPCGEGQFPTVLVSSFGAGPIKGTYPRITWGVFGQQLGGATTAGDGLSKMIIATAICAVRTTDDVDRVITEAAYTSSEGKLKIVRQELLVPRNNPSNLKVLP